MDVEILIIGAGVVGLAVAAELSTRHDVLVVERAHGIGQGISSRNSEVVHGGIYYEPGSLKARLCVEGRRKIEEWASQGHFAYRQVGKYIVATAEEEIPAMLELLERGRANGVEGLRQVSLDELAVAEPAVRAVAALWSPCTGIVDSHGLMRFLWAKASRQGAQLALGNRVVGLRAIHDGWEVEVEEGAHQPDPSWDDLPLASPPPVRGPRQSLRANRVVNAAGLYADRIAALAGVPVEEQGLRQYWSRGEYFAPRPGTCPPLRHLVYPVPPLGGDGHLGIHVTVDLAGGVRFGPSAHWPDPPTLRREDFHQDDCLAQHFAQGIGRFLPYMRADDLQPAGVGLRPCLRPARDFEIRLESGPGRDGLVTLLGVESPGLSSAPAIAGLVGGLLAG